MDCKIFFFLDTVYLSLRLLKFVFFRDKKYSWWDLLEKASLSQTFEETLFYLHLADSPLIESPFNSSFKLLNKNTFKVDNDTYYKDYKLYIKHDYKYPIDITEEDSFIVKVKLNKIRNIKDNMKVGKVIVYLGDQKLHSENIYISKNSFGFIEKIWEIIYSIW